MRNGNGERGTGNGEWGMGNGKLPFLRLMVYNAENIFFSGDYRDPRLF